MFFCCLGVVVGWVGQTCKGQPLKNETQKLSFRDSPLRGSVSSNEFSVGRSDTQKKELTVSSKEFSFRE